MLRFVLKYHHCNNQDRKESKIERREGEDILQGLTGIMACVFLEGDKACKGCDKSSRSTYIDSYEKIGIILGKLRKKYCGGDVTDKLTRECAYKKRILVE